MKKILRVFLILAISLVALWLTFFIVYRVKFAGREFLEFSYNETYDIEGSSRYLRITRAEDGRALLSEKITESYYQMPTVNECFVSEKILSDIESIFKKYSLGSCEKWKDYYEGEYTGNSWNVSFAFEGKNVGYNSYKKLPKREERARKEILALVEGYVLNGEPLAGFSVDKITDAQWDEIIHPSDGKLTVRLVYYWDDTIKYIISNGTGERVECDHSYRLFKAGDSKPVFAAQGDLAYDLMSGSYAEEIIVLKERLEPGEYILSVLDQEIKFEIK